MVGWSLILHRPKEERLKVGMPPMISLRIKAMIFLALFGSRRLGDGAAEHRDEFFE